MPGKGQDMSRLVGLCNRLSIALLPALTPGHTGANTRFQQTLSLAAAAPLPFQEFLFAASRGNTQRLRDFLDQGFDADSADYGGSVWTSASL